MAEGQTYSNVAPAGERVAGDTTPVVAPGVANGFNTPIPTDITESTAGKTEQEMADLGYQLDTPKIVSDTGDIRAKGDDLTKKVEEKKAEMQTMDLGGNILGLGEAPTASQFVTPEDAKAAEIARAKEEARLAYQPLVTQAETAKRMGMPKKIMDAGERGGFMSTQFSGRAALEKTMGRDFVGAGGLLEEQKSAYDSTILQYRQQQIAAMLKAEKDAKDFIETGDNQKFKDALEAFKATNDAKIAEEDAKVARADLVQKANNYQLEVEKFDWERVTDVQKNKLDNAKLDLDIASAKGMFADGTQTMLDKSRVAKELTDKFGLQLDEKKLQELIRSNKAGEYLENAKLSWEKSKADAESAGVDVNQAAKNLLNGIGDIKDYPAATQVAIKAKVNAVANINSQAFDETGNLAYKLTKTAAGGKQLTAGQAGDIAKVLSVKNRVNNLNEIFQRLKDSGKVGPVIGRLKKLDIFDDDVIEFKGALAGVVPGVARGIFGEVGVLTDNDMRRYGEAIADISSPEAAADAIMDNLLKTLSERLAADLSSAANAGYDVSGYATEYQQFKDSINDSLGIPRDKRSANPAIYNNVEDFYGNITQEARDMFRNQALTDMEAAGIDDINDYFDFLKETSENKFNTNIKPPTPESNGNNIDPDFNNVGGDTDAASEDLGSLSEKYESGGDPGVIGYDKVGGSSYGVYQLAHNNAQTYVNQSKYANEFKGIPFNSQEFQNKWKEIAARDPKGFKEDQKNYIRDTFYTPVIERIEKAGIDTSNFSPTLKNVVWSTAVQHGANTNIVSNAYKAAEKKLGRKPNEKELITQIYNERWAGGQQFRSSTDSVKASVKNRFIAEREQALKNLA